MFGHIAISLTLLSIGIATKLTVVSIMSVILLLAPTLGKRSGIGWTEFSPRVVIVCLIIIGVAAVFWSA